MEKELGAYNFSFEMEHIQLKDQFFDVGMFELGFQARDLITSPGRYSLKLIVTELNTDAPMPNILELPIEQSNIYKQAACS